MRFKYILLSLLIASSLRAQVAYVSGEQFGTWGTGDTLSYYVTGNVTVPTSYFLTILPGVEVRFQGQYKITVQGGLTAWGTETDSVIFNTFEPDPWQYIEFINAWGDSTTLNYCHFQSGERAVWVSDCQASLNHCLIQGMTSSPVRGDNATIYLTECTITGNGGNGLLIDNTSVTLNGCEIRNNSGANGRGIYAQNSSTISVSGGEIRNNLGSGIYGLSIGTTTLNGVEIAENGSHGIELNSSGELNASRVLSYHNNLHGIFLVNTALDATNLTVSTNVERGVSFTGGMLDVLKLRNSIVDRNGAEGIYFQSGLTYFIEYNNAYLNFLVNYSGCEPDTITSIVLDPQYVDWVGMDYNLQETSPCIDAGDPNPIYNDPDGTRTDMGALYYNQLAVVIEPNVNSLIATDFRIIDAFPNPFNPVLTIRVQASAPATAFLEAWTAQGRLVDRFWEGQLQPGINVTTWNADRFSSGVYVIRMTSGQNIDTVPCILLK